MADQEFKEQLFKLFYQTSENIRLNIDHVISAWVSSPLREIHEVDVAFIWLQKELFVYDVEQIREDADKFPYFVRDALATEVEHFDVFNRCLVIFITGTAEILRWYMLPETEQKIYDHNCMPLLVKTLVREKLCWFPINELEQLLTAYDVVDKERALPSNPEEMEDLFDSIQSLFDYRSDVRKEIFNVRKVSRKILKELKNEGNKPGRSTKDDN